MTPERHSARPGHRPWRIRFGDLPAWHAPIRGRIDRWDFRPSFGPLRDVDATAVDAVVPLSLDDYSDLRTRPDLAGKAIMPSEAAMALCHDKLALDAALQRLGFDAFRPGPPSDPAPYPYVAKCRHGDTGRGTVIVRDAADEAAQADFLARPDILRQRLLADRFEYAAHFLMRDGRVIFQRTMRHEMHAAMQVKGDGAMPRRSRPLGHDPYAADFARLLRALDYQGTACIDYKVEAGRAQIMEINPRMGSSLLRSINDYLDAYLVALGLAAPRRQAIHRLVAQRRTWTRRLRRWLAVPGIHTGREAGHG